MSMDDAKSFGRARLSFAREADVDKFVAMLGQFEKGEIGPDEWRAFRLVQGAYGQRQEGDLSMLRIKIPQGILTAAQLRAVAGSARQYSRGFGHITTRQCIQLHFLKLHEVEHVMRICADAGITTREACGNSVRNITCCPWAGVSKEEPFDVTPYAEALTRFLLRHPLSGTLPRKFKIAFEGCNHDHAYTSIHDLGFTARVQDGKRGFRLTVGGGTAILCTDGSVLYDFLPVERICEVAEAVVRIFHERGDRKRRQAARLKFLVRSMGWEAFKAEFHRVLAESKAPLELDPPVEGAPTWRRLDAPSLDVLAAKVRAGKLKGPGIAPVLDPKLEVDPTVLARWRRSNVTPQKQAGFSSVLVTVPLGDLSSEQMEALADLSAAHGDGSVRVTVDQNVLFRWVPDDQVDALYRGLSAAGLHLPDAQTPADVTSCPGAESCKLAVTQSRGLGRTIGEFMRSRTDLVDLAKDLVIKMSGCPNGCGQHHIAGIGFQGSVRKLGTRAVPQYFVMVGGGSDAKGAHFGRIAAKIPARRVTAALERLIGLYDRERQLNEPAMAFFRRVELPKVKALLADLEALTEADAKDDDFIDLGETHAFNPETSAGECAA
ncbi:MAG: nitrite/sulfite reductase [Myxococcaceae bacterium]|nr:nitrite/sulfite reductase [Myxococcaceae bacterium]